MEKKMETKNGNVKKDKKENKKESNLGHVYIFYDGMKNYIKL